MLRALGLGDTLTGVPALRGVRRAWPGRRIVLAAPEPLGQWLVGLGVVDAVLPTRGLETLSWQGTGHIAVNLHGSGPESHRLLVATRPERLVAFTRSGTGGPPWRADEHEVDRWCRLVRWAGGACERSDLRLAFPGPRAEGPYVVIHPGAASASRRWPVHRWALVAEHLVSRGVSVLLTGGPDERDRCARVRADVGPELRGRVHDRAGRLDLPGLAATVAGAQLLLCGDTGVAHVATAAGTRSVLLFGPVAPHLWGPAIDHDRHTVLWHGDPDRPGDPHGDTVDPALAAISVPEVVAAAERHLAVA